MSLDVAHAVRLADHAVRIDQVRTSFRPLRHRLDWGALRLIEPPDDVVAVREDAEREAVLLGETMVVLDRVERGAEDLDAERFELGGSITEPLALARSPVGERFGEPPERHPAASQICQRDGFAVLIRQREVGSDVPFGKHRRSLRQYAESMIEVTDWARDILGRSQSAAVRFNPNTVIRIVRSGDVVEARLAEGPEPTDQPVEAGDAKVFAEAGLEGLLDIEEPHDRVVLKPPGSSPNDRGDH